MGKIADKLTLQDRAHLEQEGTHLEQVWGGPKKKKYFLPDGGTILAIPAEREYVKKKDGKIIEQGIRDANYDKGWLESPPTVLRIHCSGCDRWHDTKTEVKTCQRKKNLQVASWAMKAGATLHNDKPDDRIEAMEKKIDQLVAIVEKLAKER